MGHLSRHPDQRSDFWSAQGGGGEGDVLRQFSCDVRNLPSTSIGLLRRPLECQSLDVVEVQDLLEQACSRLAQVWPTQATCIRIFPLNSLCLCPLPRLSSSVFPFGR